MKTSSEIVNIIDTLAAIFSEGGRISGFELQVLLIKLRDIAISVSALECAVQRAPETLPANVVKFHPRPRLALWPDSGDVA